MPSLYVAIKANSPGENAPGLNTDCGVLSLHRVSIYVDLVDFTQIQ